MNKKLEKQYEEFCQQYVVDFNGARAAFDAGFGKNKTTARVTACHLLAKDAIGKRIAELLKNRSERTQITQDMVLQELAVVGFSDFRNYGRIKKDKNLEFFPFDKIKGDKTRAIESMKQVDNPSGRSISMKLHGKVKPLELIGKHLGMFVDTHNVNLTGDIRVLTAVPRSNGKEKEKPE